METIITIFTVLSMYMSASQNMNSNYWYNAEMEDGIVKTIYVFENNNEQLTRKLAYHYEYDTQGRLTEKTVCRWDEWTKEYQPEYKLEMTYQSDGYELARSVWSKKNNDWKPSTERQSYHFEGNHLSSVEYLKKGHQGQFHTTKHLYVVNTVNDMLLASEQK